jgi:hypothetical protein
MDLKLSPPRASTPTYLSDGTRTALQVAGLMDTLLNPFSDPFKGIDFLLRPIQTQMQVAHE